MTDFEELKFMIGSKSVANFVDKKPGVCYIPERAQSLEECFNYQELFDICKEWLEENKWYVADVQTLTEHLFYNIEWETPHVWLEGLTDENNE